MIQLVIALAVALLAPATAVAADVDHSAFDALLKAHVKGQQVDYAGLSKKKDALAAYLEVVGKTDPASLPSKDAQLAFWINAYNAHTIAAVLAHWPGITSVSSIQPDFGFFKTKDKLVGGKKYALNDIENEVIRPTFNDPRIHAALNCASVSCPPLLGAAFTTATLHKQLDEVMGAFVNDGKRNEITASGAKLSQIFNWYGKDFEPAGGPQKYMAKYLEGEKKAWLEAAKSVQFLAYDWNLNKT